MKTVKFTIAGQEYSLGPLSFWSLEQCWPSIIGMGKEGDIFMKMRYALNTFACGLASEPAKVPPEWKVEDDDQATIERIEKAVFRSLSKPEGDQFLVKYTELLNISGFVPSGEASAAAETPLMETGTPLSPNLPVLDAVEATGTVLREP